MKKLTLVFAIIAVLVCLLAVSVSADNQLKPQNTNAYGEISFFDESITVGRTNTKYGFTPYIDAEGTTYARVVVGDGTTFYTFPTAYILSNTAIYGEGQINTYVRSMTSLNSAMQAATGINPNWNEDNIYRIEMPYSNIRFNGGTEQGFQGYDNVIEIWLQPNSHIKDQNKSLMFWRCYDLEVIHNLDTFTFRNGCLSGAFQDCAKLTNITFGYSAEVTTTSTNAFSGCSGLVSVNLFEAFPNITTIGSGTFAGCSSIKYMSLPATITSIGSTAFQNCSSLVFVDFNGNNNVFNADSWGMFQGCKSLQAVSLPENFKLIPNRMFAGCTALKAVYLPSNLETMETNNWGEDPFNGCTNVYFVNEPFAVKDENGGFYSSTTFVQPIKPDVYFMPNTLSALCTNKTSGKCFTSCLNLNPVIVFGTNMVKTTLGDGIFYECGSNGTAGSGITAVFLGDMEQLLLSTRENRAKGVKYIFANANDKSLSDVVIKNNTTNGYNLNDKTEGFYFCHGNCYYLLNGVKHNGTYSDSVLTKVEGTLHLSNPNKAIVTPADCINARVEVQECFCGANLGEKTIGTALGHNYDLTKGAAITDILFANGYTANGCKEIKCSRCDVKDYSTVVEALFNDVKYSVAEKGFGICVKYNVNKDAIAVCKDAGMDVSFGVVAIMADKVQGNGPLANDGKLTTEKNVIAADVTADNLRAVTLRISGDESTWKSHAEKAIYVLGYATDGTDLEYLGTASDAQVDRNNITSVKSIVIGEFFKFE